MKRTDFNRFLNRLKENKDLELAGYAFLNLTDRQAVEVIKHYASIGETEVKLMPNGKTYITFGMHRQFTFPLDKYMELTK